jgi:hypothetical protein
MTALSNWGRWGADDELGTLNLVTGEVTAAAAGLVTAGRPVSCGWPVDPAAPACVTSRSRAGDSTACRGCMPATPR